eukprot:TRINITY_DN2256_c0_g1_i4.p1 TRINITY_DN2256_c0_g1~~TRINITY_DN2256_c0_g1_i4.p1  ORF type:complete len:384 (+),score=63.33 TRINITY_DN2256_c0_g1_i4:283-1434(+)
MGKKKGGGGGGGRRGRGSDSHRMGGGVGKKHASKKMFVVNHDTALEMWRAKSVGPFERGDKTLVVGDGDLSFSLALTTALGGKGLTATTYDTTRGVLSKYPHADNIISTLGSKGVRVFNGVDALTLHVDPRLTTLKTDVDARIPQELYDGYTAKLKREQKRLEREKRLKEKQQRFGKNYRPRQNEEEDEEEDILDPATYSRLHSLYDKIVFNFPHLGGVDVDKNKLLLAQFFLSSLCLVRRGRANGSDDQTDGNDDDDDNRTETECGMIMVGLRDTPFYRGWEIEKVANDVGLRLVRYLSSFAHLLRKPMNCIRLHATTITTGTTCTTTCSGRNRFAPLNTSDTLPSAPTRPYATPPTSTLRSCTYFGQPRLFVEAVVLVAAE